MSRKGVGARPDVMQIALRRFYTEGKDRFLSPYVIYPTQSAANVPAHIPRATATDRSLEAVRASAVRHCAN